MRSRSNSGVRLDFYHRMVHKTILTHQHSVSGLLPASPTCDHAWVRDNVYSALCIWALSLSYRKKADIDEDRAKAYELEMAVVKMMRGILKAMMRQVEKVEKFKYTQSPKDALHAKYFVSTGLKCTEDWQWGHLQLDATSLFLLQLAQMTASGLQIVVSLDEVAFVQNLIFYIQSAFRTPDFGIWERGDKTNHGVPELNATSIGMARAALEALNGLDLYGSKGGPSSVINVMPDESQQCLTILHSVLPRESNSKETDAGLLSIISYPAFAVDDAELIQLTKKTILEKLKGRYGICRFLRDGYKTAKEDPNRLHYYPCELQSFEHIECEWPMFFAYLVLDGLFSGNKEQVDEYSRSLEDIMVPDVDGFSLMPELYAVPFNKVDNECKSPKSQDRVPVGKIPQMWGQSLYVLGNLINEGFISPGEIDPLNRRLVAEPKPDVVVQVVILAEDHSIQEKLAHFDVMIQTFSEVQNFQVYPANVLSFIFSHLGTNEKLGLSGRPTDGVGVLATSKIYTLGDQMIVFFPQFVDQHQFYLPLDTSLLVDMIKTDVQYLGNSWNMLGRPLMVLPIRKSLLDANGNLHHAIVTTIKKIQTGYLTGTRVQIGNLSDFSSTSCMNNLTFLLSSDDQSDLGKLIHYIQTYNKRHGVGKKTSHFLCNVHTGLTSPTSSSGADKPSLPTSGSTSKMRRRNSVRGIIKRSCSIQIDANDLNDTTTNNESTDSTSTAPGSTSPGAGLTSPSVGAFSFEGPFVQTPVTTHRLKGDLLTAQSERLIMSTETNTRYEGIDCVDLVQQLMEAESLHEQADIIHYLHLNKGASWNTGLGKPGHECLVSDLLTELYEKAGRAKQWWLVRHTAGLLMKKVEDLANAASDIIVRQKQLAVGLPPEPREKIITRPMRTDELAAIIHEACQDDLSTAMLTQELLVYLAMYIRTEPKLFKEMLRIRVGLIIQVMASELARTLNCSGEEASTQLLNLTPYEMKLFLHHILSGKEFAVNKTTTSTDDGGSQNSLSTRRLSIYQPERMSKAQFASQTRYSIDLMRKELRTQEESTATSLASVAAGKGDGEQPEEELENDRHGQWLRRRRLDGALNRVPVGFYADVWKLLKRCHGVSFSNHVINQSLTSEMTQGEMKFALEVESILNRIPHPEYRQLCVETIVMLCLIVEHDAGKCFWNQVINIDRLVHYAVELFIDEQRDVDSYLAMCCANPKTFLKCQGNEGVCQQFYDCAPSGRFGSMSYLCRSIVHCLMLPCRDDGNLDCTVQ